MTATFRSVGEPAIVAQALVADVVYHLRLDEMLNLAEPGAPDKRESRVAAEHMMAALGDRRTARITPAGADRAK